MLRKTTLALVLAAAWASLPQAAPARLSTDDADAGATAALPQVTVTGDRDETAGLAAKRAASTTKSGAGLLETPQSITVVTRGLLDAQQSTTLAEALRTVAGVTPGQYGRRGFDDFIIRGMRASESTFVDGLRTAQSVQIPEELFGVEQLDVLKGPASLLFGNVQPGGMVNSVSKRPRAHAFNEAGVTIGSDNHRQATLDVGRPLNATGKAAFRVNALALDSDDPTDFVFFKTRWLAPALTLDLGGDTDLTLLASYHRREWLRQQGLPPRGTLLPNPNGPIPLNRFIGDPAMGGYDVERKRVGYALAHRFNDRWTLHQNFRWEEYGGVGPGVFNGALAANGATLSRTGSRREFDGEVAALDTHVGGTLSVLGTLHHLTLGLDASTQRERFATTTCTLPALNLFNPVYGVAIACPAAAQADTTSRLPMTGLYARDRFALAGRLDATLGLRRDRATTGNTNNRGGIEDRQTDSATTGSAGLSYRLAPGAAAYASYATSFLPVSGVDYFGARFEPETGRQSELGIKYSPDGGRVTAVMAVYDLRRRNVTTADTEHNGFSVQTGEERSRGVEGELTLNLRNGWTLRGAAAHIASEVTRDNRAAYVGKPLNNVPRRGATVWANYLTGNGALAGLGLGAGLRHESEKRGYSFDYTVPAYTVVDAAASYSGNGYRVSLNVKNLFGRDTYAGGLSNNVVTLGDPRQVRLNTVFEF
ncbi:TonB-dependent siderophore receptor [Pseudoduganella namucuonensis]|uniref:Iron complex outermembrane recepter protein n=1 Tax=Pseudoduganella namucuonensis TaxID=1035707 RepID=A0A1I7FRA2_9BURK|nr:TonB-dependent siderophore receptor [Pseudoduganella namucuonensis]SFU38675.1 iron complex outermembrane recepter protein [Pseudoduganella namucuonensis]